VRKLFASCGLLVCLFALTTPVAPARQSACQQVQAVFYTSGDWARLARTLAANASPCVQYEISIPPLAGSKTTIRPGAASLVRGLGPNFHALAEVNYSAWQGWVASTGNTWYQAGQEARRRMAAAGFNVSAGDTWAVNELSSSVAAGSGQARQDLRQLVAGLFYGDGSVPQAKGIVYAVGVSQTSTPLPAYKAELESWLQDTGFWTDMSAYVSAFFQETYGDARAYAVAGVDPSTRVAYLSQYLHYLRALAAAGPPSVATANAFLSNSYGPLANAAWAWNSNYGFTNVSSDVMADYVSAETYAMRAAGDANIGFAWDASNPGLAASDFSTQTTGVLTRMAGAIHETDGGDPAQACEATGCTAAVAGAAFVTGWATFSTWTPTIAAFTSQPQTLSTATPSTPITIQLQTGGIPTTLPNATAVTLTSSSSTGTFATDPAGPWSPTVTLTLPPGTNGASFYVQDTTAGTPTLTTSTAGSVATQAETVNAPASTVVPAIASAAPAARIGALTLTQTSGLLHLGVRVVNAGGAPLAARVSAALLGPSGTFASTSGPTSTGGWLAMTAGRRPAPGCYSAKVVAVTVPGFLWDGITPAKSYCVKPSLRIASMRLTRRHGLLHLGLRVVGAGDRPLRAYVSITILQARSVFASTVGATRSEGTFGLTARRKPGHACYSAHVAALSAPGYLWNGASPSARLCVR